MTDHTGNGNRADGDDAESMVAAGRRSRLPLMGDRSPSDDAQTPVDRLVLKTPGAFRGWLFGVAAFAILALAAVSTFLAYRQYQANQHRAVNDLNARVVLVGNIIDSSIQGGIDTLQATAASQIVRTENTTDMLSYFRRVHITGGKMFTGGIGWLNLQGGVGAGTGKSRPGLNFADRDYFKRVIATKQPYVSSGLISRGTGEPTVVVAVPTFDTAGRISGVITGGIRISPQSKPTPKQTQQNEELGFTGLTIVDRDGQLITDGLTRVKDAALLQKLMQATTGDLKGSPGLLGGSHHVIAFATSKALDWKVAIDRSESSLYASPRRSLSIDIASIALSALVALLVFGLLARRARKQIEERGGHAQSWSRLSRNLASAATAADVADALLASVEEMFEEAVSVVAVNSESGQEIRAGSSLPGWRRVTGDTDRLRAIGLLTHEGPRTLTLERNSDYRDLYVGFGGRLKALHAVPIVDGEGKPSGGIGLLTARGRLDASEWELLEAFAAQATRALDRARAFEHEHDLAVRLQRSLLPSELPKAPGIGLAGEYLAGGKGIEIGGDWYDAILRPDGILELCVGDVSGRGVGAATIMGRQRSVFRAYAYDHESPGEILRRMIRHVNDDEMITASCVMIDPLEGVLVYSSAGHPPPLLLDQATGRITRLDGASSPPLGVAESKDIVEHRIDLPGHATLALYTDGLVERRGESIEVGIEALATTIVESPALSADAALAAVAQVIGAPSDDVALLLAAISPASSISLQLPASPAILPGIRRRLRGWLHRQGFGDAEPEVILAVSEALNNSIEHGYRETDGSIELRLDVVDETLQVDIVDRGHWVVSTPSDERGRGLMLMRSLMDSVEIDTNGDGTVVRLQRRRRPLAEPVPAA